MAEVGSGNGTSWPTALDANAIPEVNSPAAGRTKARKEVVEDLTAICLRLEEIIGTSPQGSLADVKTFLQTHHQTDGTHKNTHGPHKWIDAADYATLTDAVNAAIGKTLVISSSINLTLAEAAGGAVVIPATVLGVFPMAPGVINKNTAISFTCNAPLLGNPMHQWLSGFAAGEVIFGADTVEKLYIEWVGGKADNSVDNITALNIMKQSQQAPYIQLLKGVYRCTGPFDIDRDGVILAGTTIAAHSSVIGTRLHNIGGAGLDALYLNGGYNKTVKSLQVTGSSSSRYGINISASMFWHLEDVMLGDYTASVNFGHGSHGLRISNSGAFFGSADRVTSSNNYGRGLELTSGANLSSFNECVFRNNALDGIYVNGSLSPNTYLINFLNCDVSGNGHGTPSGSGGTSGFGIYLTGYCMGINFKNINYEINGNSNKVYQLLTVGYGPVTYEEIHGDNQYYDIVSGNNAYINKIKGSSKTIVWGADTNFCVAEDVDSVTTVTDNATSNLNRTKFAQVYINFASLDATPSVLGRSICKTNNAGATTITDLDDGYVGQVVMIIIGDANTTVDFTGTNLKGNAGADWSPGLNDTMQCTYNSTYWYCVVNNTA